MVAFWIRNVISNLVLFPSSPIIAVVVGLAISRRRPVFGKSLIGIGIVTLFVFSLPIVANTLAAYDERAFPPLDPSTPLPKGAAIVVLGGGLQYGAVDYPDGTVNPTALARLRSAARLAARTHLPILVTGGLRDERGHAEGDAMADALTRDFATPVRWIENASLDTTDNARLSVPILAAAGITQAILVTDVSHMRRARALFEAAGTRVVPAPTDYFANGPINALSFIPNGSAMRRSAWAMHEWLGLLWMHVRG